MGKKYIKCPRCELNYILEGEDYCNVCKSEMKHHSEADEDLLDLEDMELCPVCGQNYIREDQTMCDECRGRSKSKSDDDSKDWKDDEEIDEEDSMVSASSDLDGEEEYNSGFSDIDPDAEDDPYKTDDDLMDDSPIEFAMDEEDLEEDDLVSETLKDDFETVEVSGDDEEDEEDEEDDDYGFEGDMLGKKK